jgi:ribonucleoside-diphosphate reductase alpha subunit
MSVNRVSVMSNHIYVTKRDGTREPVSFDQILQRLQRLAKGLEHVNTDLVAQKVCSQIADGIKTSDLDEFAAETCAMMQARNHPNYGKLAARIVIDNHQKLTPSTLKECVDRLAKDCLVSEDYVWDLTEYPKELEAMIDYTRDFNFNYFGFKTLEKGYLLRTRDGKACERPQHMWMRVALQLHGCFEYSTMHLLRVKETYDALSLGYFIHATPTLFNAGTRHPQLSSCFLLTMEEDSIKGIYKTLGDCAQISKWAGGIGLALHDIRAKDSHIQGTNGKSTGLVPMLKVFNDTAKYVNQGGKRNGSFAMYLEPWHADIEDFLRLKLNTGAEEERARDLFYGLWIPDLFMERVESDGLWSLMCPAECPGLADVWGDKFKTLYESYETAGKFRRQIPAKKLWQTILDSQIQTGAPYLCYKDAANSKSNQRNLGTIRSSNLCTEIIEFTSPTETAVCNLGSLALPRFVNDGKFDFTGLRKFTRILVRNLDIVIDKNFYPTPETRTSNKRHRPVGLGVQGLADVFALMSIPWTSEQATQLNREIFENIYFAAVEASMEIASEDLGAANHYTPVGAYSTFKGSPASEGKLQFDLWGQQPTQTPYLNWTELKSKVDTHGLRNSLLVAPMPTASTSQILGNNECIEPFTSNLYTRRVLAGEFVVINEYLVDRLVSLGLWNADVRSQIIAQNGSIQGIQEIPQEVRDLYKTSWEIPMKTLINLAADRAPFICQSQSLNLFVAEPSYSKISSMHFYAWKKGLKTGCYYLRTKAVAKAQQFTVEPCLTCTA